MTDKPELLLCPFCGSPAGIRQILADKDFFRVSCTNPECGVDIRDTRENAIRLWNTRVEK